MVVATIASGMVRMLWMFCSAPIVSHGPADERRVSRKSTFPFVSVDTRALSAKNKSLMFVDRCWPIGGARSSMLNSAVFERRRMRDRSTSSRLFNWIIIYTTWASDKLMMVLDAISAPFMSFISRGVIPLLETCFEKICKSDTDANVQTNLHQGRRNVFHWFIKFGVSSIYF